MATIYTKYDISEPIQVGDLISLKDNNTVTRSFQWYNKKPDTRIIGVCTKLNDDNTIEVQNEGQVDVNIIGLSSLGSMITASDEPGKGKIMRYQQESRMFNIRPIGKIIKVYNNLNKVTVLLNLE